jgi:metallo-beta-lactamase family protein
MATLTFCGAAGTVTGSCSHLVMDQTDFLIDCGLFQGNRTVRDLNHKPFPFDARRVDFMILTHAHIDHSGLIPKLTRAGFDGPIYATPATADLLEFMLRDSATIQESNAERANRKRRRRDREVIEPIYTLDDAEQALKQLKPIDYETWADPAPNVRFRLWNAGHILGSASAELKLDPADSANALRLLFSGDLGPDEKTFHPEPDAPDGFDYIVCESTYGDRDREDYTLEKRRAALREELRRGLARGGNVVIPSFAVERSQELLHDIGVLLSRREIPDATVYLDSPLARKVTEVFAQYAGTLEDLEMDASELFRHERFHLVEHLAPRVHGPVRRLPGAGNTGPRHFERQAGRPHPRQGVQSTGRDTTDRQLFGPRGPGRIGRLDHGALTGRGRVVPQSRRRRGPGDATHRAGRTRTGPRQDSAALVRREFRTGRRDGAVEGPRRPAHQRRGTSA